MDRRINGGDHLQWPLELTDHDFDRQIPQTPIFSPLNPYHETQTQTLPNPTFQNQNPNLQNLQLLQRMANDYQNVNYSDFFDPADMQNHHHHQLLHHQQLNLEEALNRLSLAEAASSSHHYPLYSQTEREFPSPPLNRMRSYSANLGLLNSGSDFRYYQNSVSDQNSVHDSRHYQNSVHDSRHYQNSVQDSRYYQNPSAHYFHNQDSVSDRYCRYGTSDSDRYYYQNPTPGSLYYQNSFPQSFPKYTSHNNNSNINNRPNVRRRSSSHEELHYNRHHQTRASSARLDPTTPEFNRASNSATEKRNGEIIQSRNYSSMEQVRGRIAEIAKTRDGSSFLERKIEELIPEQTEMIFLEMKEHLFDLAMESDKHAYASGVIQKLFLACNQEQLDQFFLIMIQSDRFPSLCNHIQGTRVVQKMIDLVRDDDEKKSLIASALKNRTVYLAKNQNGHHVIQQCLKYFHPEYTQHMLEEIAESCVEIATDRSGCCVLQKSIEKAKGEVRDRMINQIIDHAFVLSVDSYGNYVVQFILQMGIPQNVARILENLRGDYVNLSKDKFGSNVVEKCLKDCGGYIAAGIIHEIMQSPSFLEVVQNEFGNYVIQSALRAATGEQYHNLVCLINRHSKQLHSHLHGKKVLARTQSRNRHNHVRIVGY
ncbi:pumilio homolog 12-like [Mercurialis annua]|uniref:pumilio homolog 12-like n=1 Tax=Mercurialis annua TaxID=3986 RepID=UPI00215F4BE0|nr:pumilio homolog 12-like [Mercurialis annua]